MAALTTRLFAELYAEAPGVLDRAKDFEHGIELGVDLLCDRFAPKQALVRLILGETGSIRAAVEARRRAYELLAGFLAARLALVGERRGQPSSSPSELGPAGAPRDPGTWTPNARLSADACTQHRVVLAPAGAPAPEREPA